VTPEKVLISILAISEHLNRCLDAKDRVSWHWNDRVSAERGFSGAARSSRKRDVHVGWPQRRCQQHAISNMQSATCNQQHAISNMQSATCLSSCCQAVISFLVLRSCLLNHVGRQGWWITLFVPATLRQPFANKLFVERSLSLSGTIIVCSPEA